MTYRKLVNGCMVGYSQDTIALKCKVGNIVVGLDLLKQAIEKGIEKGFSVPKKNAIMFIVSTKQVACSYNNKQKKGVY